MGFLDSLQGTLNRGTAAAERATRTLRLNQRVNDINKERQRLAAQLGASLYEATKDDASFRAGREALFDGIANLDAEREKCQLEIASIEAEAAAARTYTCTHCGASVSATDLFCSGCGTAIDVIKQEIAEQNAAAADSAANSNRVCASCGAAMGEDDMFCMSCGTKYDPAAESRAQADEEPATDDAFAPKEEDTE